MKRGIKKITSKLFSKKGNNLNTEKVNSEFLLIPTHTSKQNIIRDAQKQSGIKVLVETGTYLGDMIEAQKIFFDKIYSIELGELLYNNAVERFKNDKTIKIFKGDSGEVLPQVLSQIYEPCIFWLDGHYSEGITAKGKKDSPIFEELTAIFKSKQFPHILLIDDARLFDGTNDYPTITDLKKFIEWHTKDSQFVVENDIIIVRLK